MRRVRHAQGSFDVKATPQPAAEDDDPGISRMTFDKQFHGDLEGTSRVQMLAANTSVKLSGAFVAVEKSTQRLRATKVPSSCNTTPP